MSIPRGSRVDGDGVRLMITPSIRFTGVILLALSLCMAIGVPIDQAPEGRLGTALIISACCVPFILLGAWAVFLAPSTWWQTRVDDEGIHRRWPAAVARWGDIAEITAGPTTQVPIKVSVPAGLVRPDGTRKGTALHVGARYVAGGRGVYAYLHGRWQQQTRV